MAVSGEGCELLLRGYSARVLAAVGRVVIAACLVLPVKSVLAALGDAPVLSSAASRKMHGAAGTFNLPLSLNLTNPTTEPRSGPTHTLVFVFDKAVTSGAAVVTEGTATASAPTFNGSEMVVSLAGVANQQYVTVAVTNVVAADGGTGGAGAVRVGLLMGDVNQSRVVSLSDLGQVNAQLAQVVTAANFLNDVNASGTLSLADKGVTNTQLTKATPAVPVPPEQPPQVNAGANQVVTLPAAASLTGNASDDGLPGPLTLTWSNVSGPGTVNFGNPNVGSTSATFSAPGTYVLRLTANDGMLVNSDDLTVTVNPEVPIIPPDPATVAPPLDPTLPTSVFTGTGFIYTGPTPIQTGVAPGTIKAARAAVVRGKVLSSTGAPLSGVTITVLQHPEFGQTLSRADGMFDMVVNGGGLLTITYRKTGLATAQRQVNAPLLDYVRAPDAALIPLDGRVTAVDLTATATVHVAQANPATDADGTRQATILFPAGTLATMTLPGGSTTILANFHVRATEFTVGANGPTTMPASLPPSSGFTYEVEYSIDEADAAGATRVDFSNSLVSYTENFLGFPVGTLVPSGEYDRTKGMWIATANGRVIKLLDVSLGQAILDIDGSGLAASVSALAALGIGTDELQKLAELYPIGQSLWRVPIDHFLAMN